VVALTLTFIYPYQKPGAHLVTYKGYYSLTDYFSHLIDANYQWVFTSVTNADGVVEVSNGEHFCCIVAPSLDSHTRFKVFGGGYCFHTTIEEPDWYKLYETQFRKGGQFRT